VGLAPHGKREPDQRVHGVGDSHTLGDLGRCILNSTCCRTGVATKRIAADWQPRGSWTHSLRGSCSPIGWSCKISLGCGPCATRTIPSWFEYRGAGCSRRAGSGPAARSARVRSPASDRKRLCTNARLGDHRDFGLVDLGRRRSAVEPAEAVDHVAETLAQVLDDLGLVLVVVLGRDVAGLDHLASAVDRHVVAGSELFLGER